MRQLWILIIISIMALSLFSSCSNEVASFCPPDEFFSGKVHCLGESKSDVKSDPMVHYDNSAHKYYKAQYDNGYFGDVGFEFHRFDQTIQSLEFKHSFPQKGAENVDSIVKGIFDVLQDAFGDNYIIVDGKTMDYPKLDTIAVLPIIVWHLDNGAIATYSFLTQDVYDQYFLYSGNRGNAISKSIYLVISDKPNKEIESLNESKKYTRQSLGL